MKSLRIVGIFMFASLNLLIVSCTVDRTLVHATDNLLTIRSIWSDPAGFSGKKVSLAVAFKGWQGRCTGRPPVSRNDWMIEDNTGCMYVHGPLPNGLQPTSPHSEQLTLKGMVRLNRDGSPYLDLVQQ